MATVSTGGNLSINLGFSPTNVSGLLAWYDASNAGSITSSGGAVSQWNDLSGNGQHLTQSSGSAKPTTGTRTQNGLNVLDFDGGDTLSSTYGGANNGIASFMVLLYDAAAVSLWRLKQSGGLWDNYGGAFRTTAGGFDQTPGVSPSTATPYILTEGSDGSVLHCRLNAGTDQTKAHVGTSSGTGLFELAHITDVGDFLDGWVAEWFLYDNWPSTAERDALRNYLNTKWAVY